MSWNFRVMKEREKDGEVFYSIREFYTNPFGYTGEPIAAQGETVAELREELQRMLDSCDKQIYEDVDGKLREVFE